MVIMKISRETKSFLRGQIIFGKDMLEVRRVRESNVFKRFKYWKDEKRLRIWFLNGEVHDYFGVPESIVLFLMECPSNRREDMFNHNIKTDYDFKKIR